jgi:uncharacterized RDD family membrane protein YckC
MTIGQSPDMPAMGQCAVTGKMVPEDELVEIHGQRVCAEGKAILMARIASGETLPGEYDRPTVLRRFGCIFLDGLIFGIPVGLISGGLIGATGSIENANIVGLIAVIAQFIYFGAMHAAGGQTLGKKAGNEVVVNLDGSPVRAPAAYIRSLAYVGPNFLAAIAKFTLNPMAIGVTTMIVFVWALADILFALLDSSQQRSLHDRIAGTRVIVKQ